VAFVPQQAAVQELAAARLHPPLSDRVHPRHLDTGAHRLDAGLGENLVRERRGPPIPIADQKARPAARIIQIHHQIPYRLDNPARARMSRSGLGRNGSLEVHGVTVPGVLDGLALTARVGEIVGLAGVAGAGRQALLEVVSGVRPAAASLRLPGQAVAGTPPRGLRQAVRRGVAIVSGDRRLGLMLDKPIWENIAQVRSVAPARDGAVLRRSGLRRRAGDRVAQLVVRTPVIDQFAGLLSGGNQQKVVLAKWLEAALSTLLLDELASLCQRVLVFRPGQVVVGLPPQAGPTPEDPYST
jgi:ABC-type branched-subunit amino acid transport system ATPase component